jgi:hypothetical protein
VVLHLDLVLPAAVAAEVAVLDLAQAVQAAEPEAARQTAGVQDVEGRAEGLLDRLGEPRLTLSRTVVANDPYWPDGPVFTNRSPARRPVVPGLSWAPATRPGSDVLPSH